MNTKYFEILSGHICSTHSEYQMFVFPVRNWKYLIPAAAAMGWGWPRIFTPNLRRLRPGDECPAPSSDGGTGLSYTHAAARHFLILTLSHVPRLLSLGHSQIESHNLDFSISKSITLVTVSQTIISLAGWICKKLNMTNCQLSVWLGRQCAR